MVDQLQSSTLLGHRRRLNSPIWYGAILLGVSHVFDFSILSVLGTCFLVVFVDRNKADVQQRSFSPCLQSAMSFTAVYFSSGDMTRAVFGYLTEARVQHLGGSQFDVQRRSIRQRHEQTWGKCCPARALRPGGLHMPLHFLRAPEQVST